MKRLLIRTALFSLPLLAVFAFPFWVLLVSGELTSSARIIELQSSGGKPYMILQAYSDPWSSIKMAQAKRRKAEVLVLGTSRTMQFREAFFSASFYNASKAIDALSHLRLVLDRLFEEEKPRVILLGLDPNFFNPNWTWYSSKTLYAEPGRWTEWSGILSTNWAKVYADFAAGKFSLAELRRETHGAGYHLIGLNARAQERGFMNDGSLLYLYHIADREAAAERARELREKALQDIREGKGVYADAAEVSRERVEELDGFLAGARRRGIHVAAYLTPLAPSILDEIGKHGARYGYLRGITPALEPVFAKHGFVYRDFLDSRALGAGEGHFVDDVHETGEITLRILKKLAEADPVLAGVLAPEARSLEEAEMLRRSLDYSRASA